jgi:hypothetical protein
MKFGWVVKGHPYSLSFTDPPTTDMGLPREYIWINKKTDIAYILSDIVAGLPIWVPRTPDYVINVNTESPVNFIGETYLGNREVGVPVVGPPGPPGPPGTGEGGGDVPYVGPTAPINPPDGMLWWDTDDPGAGGMNEALVMYKDGAISYVCKAAIGSERTAPVWQIGRIDSNALELGITWADGDEEYDNLATSLAVVKLLNFV